MLVIFFKNNKEALITILVGVLIIFFNFVTIDHLPLGRIPAILGGVVIIKGLIKLEFKSKVWWKKLYLGATNVEKTNQY